MFLVLVRVHFFTPSNPVTSNPSLEILKKLVPNLSYLSSLEGKSFQLDKNHWTFRSRNNKRCSSPFMLVHSDVWSPCRITSFRGFKILLYFWMTPPSYLAFLNERNYICGEIIFLQIIFVIFVDDYSKLLVFSFIIIFYFCTF